MSADEIFATLKNSALPTVLIEGDDDVIVLRRLDEVYSQAGVSVLAAGGREAVLQVFSMLRDTATVHPHLFIVDRDSWVLTGVPEEFKSRTILMSEGYSIENDIVRDGKLLGLMDTRERQSYEIELGEFVRWYAVSIYKFLRGENVPIKNHPTQVLGISSVQESIALELAGDTNCKAMHDQIVKDPERLVRGKSLLAVIMRQLSYKGRSVHHNHKALFEVVASNRGPILETLFKQVVLELSDK